MKRLILVIAVAVSLFSTTFVYAETKGDPFIDIWNAIKALNTRIDNVQLLPGSQGPQGPVGPQGPKGDTGVQGPQGVPGVISNTTIVSSSASGGSWGTVTANATCPSGTILLSGGVKATSSIDPSRVHVTESYPSNTSTWTGTVSATDTGAGAMTITTYALCGQ